MSTLKVNNSRHTLSKLVQLYDDTALSDIVLKVGQKQFSTHKLILCMCSDVFKTMLTTSTWPEAHSARVILQEEPECAEVFEDFLKYFYNGCIDLNCHTVLPLLTLADKYNVQDLSKSCLEFMCTHCLPSSGGHIVSWLQYSVICGHKELEKICREFMTYNFPMIMRTAEFNLMNKDILLNFLKSSEIVVDGEGEYFLYKAMKVWLDHQSVAALGVMATQFRDLFLKIMCHIRFPMMLLSQLWTLESDAYVSHFKDFYLQKLFQAMKYHSTYWPERKDMILAATNINHFCPRNYDTEAWSTMIEVEHVPFIPLGEVQGAFFTTPASCSEVDTHNMYDWHINVFPKGVYFGKCVMIGVRGNYTICDKMLETVRISVTTNCTIGNKVEITILVMGQERGLTYVQKAITKYAIFDRQNSLFNIDDVVPYHELKSAGSQYLINNSLKLKVIIKPVKGLHTRT